MIAGSLGKSKINVARLTGNYRFTTLNLYNLDAISNNAKDQIDANDNSKPTKPLVLNRRDDLDKYRKKLKYYASTSFYLSYFQQDVSTGSAGITTIYRRCCTDATTYSCFGYEMFIFQG